MTNIVKVHHAGSDYNIGSTSIQVAALPVASSTEEGKIYQYTGSTTASLTNGYFYKCVSDGAVSPTYSWEQVSVQPSNNLPTAPTTDGTYTLTCTVSSGVATYSWVSGS